MDGYGEIEREAELESRKIRRRHVSDETDEAATEWQNAKEGEGDGDREKKASA